MDTYTNRTDAVMRGNVETRDAFRGMMVGRGKRGRGRWAQTDNVQTNSNFPKPRDLTDAQIDQLFSQHEAQNQHRSTLDSNINDASDSFENDFFSGGRSQMESETATQRSENAGPSWTSLSGYVGQHNTSREQTTRDQAEATYEHSNGDDGPTGLEVTEPENPWFRPLDDTDVGRTLGGVLDSITMDRLWNGNTFKTTLGTLMTSLVRLFTTTYERHEETTAVKLLRDAMFRGAVVANDNQSKHGTADYWEVYRQRAGFLVGWTKFRRHTEDMELKQYITRKHKTDLNMLYVTLSSPDVRVYRETTDDNAVSFIDPITGYELRTSPLLNRPLLIELRCQDMFGNIAKSTRLLDRSIHVAANNMARRKREPASVDEILTILDTSVPMKIEEQPGYDDDGTGISIEPDTEHAVLNDMLSQSMIVSMMAEEFRVFVGDAQSTAGPNTATRFQTKAGNGVPKEDGEDTEETSDGTNLLHALPKSARFRKPVFYMFHTRKGNQ